MRKKSQLLLSLVLLIALFLSGCGKISDTDAEEGRTEASSESSSTSQEIPSAEPAETPTPVTSTFGMSRTYSGLNYTVKALGLKEYKKLKTDKYTDKPSDGKIFLVLFLEIYNKTDTAQYFHADYLSAELDGEEITHTVLLNDPEDYPTMFSNIAAESYYGGFIVWEVPENWETLDVTYEGWKPSDGLTLAASFTRDDLSEPDTYSTVRYDQSGEYD